MTILREIATGLRIGALLMVAFGVGLGAGGGLSDAVGWAFLVSGILKALSAITFEVALDRVETYRPAPDGEATVWWGGMCLGNFERKDN